MNGNNFSGNPFRLLSRWNNFALNNSDKTAAPARKAHFP